MQRIVDVKTMRESDAKAIAGGVAGRELMLRAAKGVFESYPWKGKTAIVCGTGNNAGDGYALALLLQEAKIACEIILLSDRFSEDGAYYFNQCCENKIPSVQFADLADFSPYTEIVDCIFGTGFRGDVTGIARDAIHAINESGKHVISVDINSGLDGDSGTASLCVKSDLTVSIGTLKQGLLLNGAKDVIKRLVNVDIGIPILSTNRYLLEAHDFSSLIKPRCEDSHKGSYGYVSIMGGCTEYAGAVKLANLSCAALRAGCGVAQLIISKSLAPSVAPYLLESTLALLDDTDGHMIFDASKIDRILSKQAALAVGMGWGSSAENKKILTHVLKTYRGTLLIDADGLNTLAELDLDLLKQTHAQVILTPHLKEMERLSKIPLSDIRNSPVKAAEHFAKTYGITLLLKGPCTVVTDGNVTYFVNRGCAGMATAGSGDVLSGILAGLLGYAPAEPLTAACGAYIAGLAGELAQNDVNPISMLASDTVSHIAEAIGLILNECPK